MPKVGPNVCDVEARVSLFAEIAVAFERLGLELSFSVLLGLVQDVFVDK